MFNTNAKVKSNTAGAAVISGLEAVRKVIPEEKPMKAPLGMSGNFASNFSLKEKIEDIDVSRKDIYAMAIIGLLAWGVFKR